MKTVGDLDELRGDADSAPDLSHTSFQDVVDVELLADLSELDVFSAEKERRRAASHFQARQVGEDVDDLFDQPVAEILVFLVRTHVGKGQQACRQIRRFDQSCDARVLCRRETEPIPTAFNHFAEGTNRDTAAISRGEFVSFDVAECRGRPSSAEPDGS